ncbi:MAG: DUF433 domain-containing protein [Chloroflexi bacterium]|nr:DUF433 domain-containing protein [Chloroflexota bacterium]
MATEIKTEHPHIVRTQGIRGGRPCIEGTGITVMLIAKFYKMGCDPDQIMGMYPHLSAASVYDAISYYHDHQDEIEEDIAESTLEKFLEKTGSHVDEHGQVVFRP